MVMVEHITSISTTPLTHPEAIFITHNVQRYQKHKDGRYCISNTYEGYRDMKLEGFLLLSNCSLFPAACLILFSELNLMLKDRYN